MRSIYVICLTLLVVLGFVVPVWSQSSMPLFAQKDFQSSLFNELGTEAQAASYAPTPFDSVKQDSSWMYMRPPVTTEHLGLEFLGGLSGAYAAATFTSFTSYLTLPFLLSSNAPTVNIFNILGYIWAASSILGIAYGVFMVGNNLEHRSANFWITLAMTLAGTALGFALVNYLAPVPDSPQRILGLLTLPLFASAFGVWGYNLTAYFTGPPKNEYYQQAQPAPEGFDYGSGLLNLKQGKARLGVPQMRGGYEPRYLKDWYFSLNLFKFRF